MEMYVNEAGMGLVGWLVIFLAFGLISMYFKKNKDKKEEDSN